MSKSTKLWTGVFSAILILCCAASYCISKRAVETHMAGIYQNGELVREIDLSNVTESYEFTLAGEYGSNTVHVDQDGIYIVGAGCPDQTCVLHGPLTSGGTPIVCLPNRVVIRWISGDHPEIDARTGS